MELILAIAGEEWKKLKHFNYSISNMGRIRNEATGKIFKGSNASGYPMFSLMIRKGSSKKRWTAKIHSLVAEHFIGPRPHGYWVNHKNGIKHDNRVDNLEYCTPKENMQHAVRTRLMRSGEDCPYSKLKAEDVRMILKAKEIGFSANRMAKAFGVSRMTIDLIYKGKNWKGLKC